MVRTLGFILLSISDKNVAATLVPNDPFFGQLCKSMLRNYTIHYGPNNVKIHVYLDKDEKVKC